MTFETQAPPVARDRRVRRSRAALMAAAIALVTAAGTADVPVSAIAEAADVSRRLVYLQFGDLDTLLLEAALDLARRELLPQLTASDGPENRSAYTRALVAARHMARHRAFYRALLTSSCAFALSKALNSLFLPLNRQALQALYGECIDPRTLEDLASLLTGGWGAYFNTWVVEGPDPLDPEAFADRLVRAASALTAPGEGAPRGAGPHVKEQDR